MKKTMLQILTEVSEGKKSPEEAKGSLVNLFKKTRQLEFNDSELKEKQQKRLWKYMRKVYISVRIDGVII